MSGDATQDRFLGAILGMAVGDAFGMPVAGWSATTIADFHGVVTDYLVRKFPDGEEISPGEITDETEIALCVIESVTAAHGEIDVENIGIRMTYLARGDSRRWMSDGTASALEHRSEEAGFRLPLVDDEDVGPDVIARGIPVGLLHSMGPLDAELLAQDVDAVTRITHGSPLALSVVEVVARAVLIATRGSGSLAELSEQVLAEIGEGEVRDALASQNRISAREPRKPDLTNAVAVIAEAIRIVESTDSFQVVLERAVALGGPTDSRAALAACLYAGRHGSAVIPQRLIDGLESRIYVSLAVPWFYRTVAKRSGRSIDLRFKQDRF